VTISVSELINQFLFSRISLWKTCKGYLIQREHVLLDRRLCSHSIKTKFPKSLSCIIFSVTLSITDSKEQINPFTTTKSFMVVLGKYNLCLLSLRKEVFLYHYVIKTVTSLNPLAPAWNRKRRCWNTQKWIHERGFSLTLSSNISYHPV